MSCFETVAPLICKRSYKAPPIGFNFASNFKIPASNNSSLLILPCLIFPIIVPTICSDGVFLKFNCDISSNALEPWNSETVSAKPDLFGVPVSPKLYLSVIFIGTSFWLKVTLALRSASFLPWTWAASTTSAGGASAPLAASGALNLRVMLRYPLPMISLITKAAAPPMIPPPNQ